jgi:hypothetical protein
VVVELAPFVVVDELGARLRDNLSSPSFSTPMTITTPRPSNSHVLLSSIH